MNRRKNALDRGFVAYCIKGYSNVYVVRYLLGASYLHTQSPDTGKVITRKLQFSS